ncbi:uncharacterized protein [Argopecten irradians]|uniref:uncharacterized protein isoform X1 n=1 Tax=Argopecten irradians TaxID=31199 RepID=UPI0037248DB7
MASSYNSYVQREMKLYVGCDDGLYNIYRQGRRGLRCRPLIHLDNGVYEQILRETDQQEILSNLGIGMDKSLPNNLNQYIIKQIRPDSTSAATQVKQSTTEFETQTYSTGLNQQDMASQAVQDTMNTSVQAVQDIMSSSVQAVQDTMDTGVQAVLDKYQRMFHFNESGRIEGELDGEQFIMGEVESNIILKMMKNRMTTKSGDSEVRGISNTHHQTFHGDSLQGATAAVAFNTRCDVIAKKMKKMQEDKPRFHQKVPYEGHLEKYLTTTSPFPEFGYTDLKNIPSSLDDINIPVIEYTDITYQQTENNTVVLGRGGFGCVYFAKHSQFTVDMCVKEYEEESTTLYDIHHEAQILLYLQSTNFVPQCFGLMVSPFISTDVSLVQECFAKGYTLRKLIKDRPHTFRAKRKWIALVYQLFWGLKMIHEKQILINDIKSDNVLVNWQSDDMTNIVRYIDMGLASFRRGHRFSADPNYHMQYREEYAPEIREGHYSTPASDVYAVGYMVDEICETFGIIEVDEIAQMCTEDDPRIRPSCQFVLEKLEDILENT